MLLTLKELKQLSVETQSGTQLGQVSDVIFQTEGQTVAQYIVKSSMLSTLKYTIHQRQVITISATKMVVDDMVIPSEKKMTAQQDVLSGKTQPATLSQIK